MKKTLWPEPEARSDLLVQRQKAKMARSSHAYVRGSTARFYEWLAGAERALPEGPPIWICGDCHLSNLGPVGSVSGKIAIQIRDFDQTVIGNPVHDLVRLALSLASAARGSDLPGVATARMLEQMIEGYLSAFRAEEGEPQDDEVPQAIRATLKRAVRRRWADLARERIVDERPTVPLGKTFWPLSKEERDALAELAASGPFRDLVTALRSRDPDADVELVDAAYWVKGCSSLGRLRYALLVAIGTGEARELTLVDVKEAVRAAAPRKAGAAMPRDNGRRVVEGARALSPYLGRRMTAGRVIDRSVFIRELLPQDLKLDIGQLTEVEAVRAARFLARVVGVAHARQLDESGRSRWSAELGRNFSKTLDAPSWLWNSVVELLASHEAAYLEHCRRFGEVAA